MWTAAAGGAVATMTIEGGDTISIPAGESISGEPEGVLLAPTFVFTGTVSYFVDYHI